MKISVYNGLLVCYNGIVVANKRKAPLGVLFFYSHFFVLFSSYIA